MKLTDFRVLTFDCYGTLIDWEAGVYAALAPLLSRADNSLHKDKVFSRFAHHETEQEAQTPAMPYAQLLAAVYLRMAKEWSLPTTPEEATRFGASVAQWPAFDDSSAGLQYLKRHYKLFILSNVDRASFRGSNARLGVEFDGIYTAEDIGSYKPDIRNFHYLLQRLESDHGVDRSGVLHVAQSLFHDHLPANKVGLASAWIDRRHASGGWGMTAPPPEAVKYNFRFTSMAELCAAHRSEIRRA